MDERICESCKNPFFADANLSICNVCIESLFNSVKEYISENRNATINEVIENTNVKRKYINKWLREGRLDLKSKLVDDEMKKINDFKNQVAKITSLVEDKENDKLMNKQKPKFHIK
ncbi:hypothetical protein [Helicovermis profundi]|uniref:Uncharacterized protein n=1 Tax=Helicovermis profundi TaxID=3065157 RepID=A0AAU9E3X1_9FIRM|nr:hypothetical protein HLPR_14240 [Clostridia bacterium S502]